MSGRIEQQPAFILHRRPYRETSLLLDVITPDFGRLAMVARGGRGGRGRDLALYQPFEPLWLGWTGRSSLKTLTAIESRPLPEAPVQAGSRALSGEWLFAGFYLNELLLLSLMELEPVPRLFQGYEASLLALWQQAPLEPVLRAFELLLLDELGLGLDYEWDARSGEAIEADAEYWFQPQLGFVRAEGLAEPEAPPYRAGHPADMAATGLRVRGETLLAMARCQFDSPQVLRQSKQILRRCIDELLQGRELRSRQLFKQYKESQRA